MVLSQDVETGELALKPVVRTTLRAPETIYCIKTESGDIRATVVIAGGSLAKAG